jgi:chromosome segregation ATPase
MIAWLEARIWQVGAISGGVVALGLVASLGVTLYQKAGVERDLARTQVTLEQVRSDLTACRNNTKTLEGSIQDQNQAIDDLRAEGEARKRDAEVALSLAQRESAALRSRITGLLSAPTTGANACERVLDVDRAVVEAFQ